MNTAFQRYECFHCEKDFDELENGMCPYCHSTDWVDRADQPDEREVRG